MKIVEITMHCPKTGKVLQTLTGKPKPIEAYDCKVRRINGPDGNQYMQLHHNLIVNVSLSKFIPSTDPAWGTVSAWFPKGRLVKEATEKQVADLRALAIRYRWQLDQADAKARHHRAKFCFEDCRRQWSIDAETTFGVMRRYVESWGFELVRYRRSGLLIVKDDMGGNRVVMEVTY